MNESDGQDENSLKYEKLIDGMKCYTPENIKTALLQAGFTSVESDHYKNKAWITVIAKK